MISTKYWIHFTAAAGAALLLTAAHPLKAELSLDERNGRLSAIAADAQDIQADAKQMQLALRTKTPDFAAVGEMLSELSNEIDTLQTHILALGESSPAWASNSEAYREMKNKAQLLRIFANNKGALLDSPQAMKNRKILAAKAKGIAYRASLLSDYAGVDAD